MTYLEITQLLESIAGFSCGHYSRLPTKVFLPSGYLDILFNRTSDHSKSFNRYGYHSWYGYFEIYESKTLTKPKIIFTLPKQ